jgi:hypothetical protein
MAEGLELFGRRKNMSRAHQSLAASCLRWLAAAATAALSSTAAAEDFYAGKQITYIVGAGVGGG